MTVDVEALARSYFEYTNPCPTRSPIRLFSESVVGRDAARGPRVSRDKQAKAVVAVLGQDNEDPELVDLVESLPAAPAAEVAIVWALLRERRASPPDRRAMAPASLLVQAELMRICRRAANTLRGWSVLPGHRDDTAGVEWALSAFQQISGSCYCGGHACKHPAIHMIVAWLEPETHTGRDGGRKSRYFALVSWLERACCGHSPPFKLVETFNQGLIAVVQPDLVAGKAAMRTCRCDESAAPEIVAKGRRCRRCGKEPASALQLRRKVVNKTCYVQERLQRCGGGQDGQHFFELLDHHCPECGWRPQRRSPLPEQHRCAACGTRFPVFEATCPECSTRAPKARGIVQAWVYRPFPRPRFDHLQPTALQTIGLSAEASQLLMALHAEGGEPRMAVRRFVTNLTALSPGWRQADDLIGAPSPGEERDADDALERLCCWVHYPEDERLLRGEFEELLSRWHEEKE